jgi:hypothetical protein
LAARLAAGREGLDDNHAAAAARTGMREGRRLVGIGGVSIGRLALGLWDGEQFARPRDAPSEPLTPLARERAARGPFPDPKRKLAGCAAANERIRLLGMEGLSVIELSTVTQRKGQLSRRIML